jgi:3-hexulose-6-phosphate synthase
VSDAPKRCDIVKDRDMGSIELQVALDLPDKDRMMRIVSEVADVVDRIEVGTPFILRYGMSAIADVRRAVPSAFIVADCKIMDYGRVTAAAALEYGADSVIVQASASRATLEAVCDTACNMDRQVMVDGLGIYDAQVLARKIQDLPFSHVIIHIAVDEQHLDLALLVAAVAEAKRTNGLPSIAVAGCITPTNVQALMPLTGIQLLVVGGAIGNSDAPRNVALNLRAIIAPAATALLPTQAAAS